MALTAAQFKEFENLIVDRSGSRERECADFLALDCAYLYPTEPIGFVSTQEYRNRFGSGDLIIVGEVVNDIGRPHRIAYLWELKSPQSFVMEKDENDNRYRPTAELLKAENQLIHYYYDVYGSDTYRSEFGLMERDNIKIGGIVIGTFAEFAKGTSSDGEVERAIRSLQWRSNILYDKYKIRVITWDRILEAIRPAQN